MIVLLLAGAGVGAGVWMLASAFVPQRPDLVAALTGARKIGVPRPAVVSPGKGVQARLESALSRWRIATPDADLAVAGVTRGRFLLLRVGVVSGCLLLGQIYTAVVWALDLGISPALPQVMFLLLAIIGWVAVGFWVKDLAAARRRQMRFALVSYLTLVALHRAAGSAMGEALAVAATASPAWTFRRIGERIARSSRSGESPWSGLADLAEELGIKELSDIASIAHTAGTGGAGVYGTLMARAGSLRRELQKREETLAVQAATKLALPRVLLVLVSIGFMAFPAAMKLLVA